MRSKSADVLGYHAGIVLIFSLYAQTMNILFISPGTACALYTITNIPTDMTQAMQNPQNLWKTAQLKKKKRQKPAKVARAWVDRCTESGTASETWHLRYDFIIHKEKPESSQLIIYLN